MCGVCDSSLTRATSLTEELSQLGLKPGRKLRFEYAELKQSEKAQAEDVALTQHVEVPDTHRTHRTHDTHDTHYTRQRLMDMREFRWKASTCSTISSTRRRSSGCSRP
jgi:hypothetical protein